MLDSQPALEFYGGFTHRAVELNAALAAADDVAAQTAVIARLAESAAALAPADRVGVGLLVAAAHLDNCNARAGYAMPGHLTELVDAARSTFEVGPVLERRTWGSRAMADEVSATLGPQIVRTPVWNRAVRVAESGGPWAMHPLRSDCQAVDAPDYVFALMAGFRLQRSANSLLHDVENQTALFKRRSVGRQRVLPSRWTELLDSVPDAIHVATMAPVILPAITGARFEGSAVEAGNALMLVAFLRTSFIPPKQASPLRRKLLQLLVDREWEELSEVATDVVLRHRDWVTDRAAEHYPPDPAEKKALQAVTTTRRYYPASAESWGRTNVGLTWFDPTNGYVLYLNGVSKQGLNRLPRASLSVTRYDARQVIELFEGHVGYSNMAGTELQQRADEELILLGKVDLSGIEDRRQRASKLARSLDIDRIGALLMEYGLVEPDAWAQTYQEAIDRGQDDRANYLSRTAETARLLDVSVDLLDQHREHVVIYVDSVRGQLRMGELLPNERDASGETLLLKPLRLNTGSGVWYWARPYVLQDRADLQAAKEQDQFRDVGPSGRGMAVAKELPAAIKGELLQARADFAPFVQGVGSAMPAL